jgi:urea transport system permease protein
MNIDILPTAIFDALSITSILVIAALGLGIIYGMMGVINLAHGEFIMLGAYFTYIFSNLLALNIWLSMTLAPLPVALIALVIERGIIRFLYGRQMDTLLATWGISIALIQVVRIIFGPEGKTVVHPFPGTIEFFNTTFAKYRLLLILLTLLVLAGTYFILKFTNFGLKARAVSHNKNMSAALGINTSHIYMMSFSLGGGLAALAGALLTPLINIEPSMGLKIVVKSFLVVVTGGANILFGPILGATILGSIESLVSLFTSTYLGNVILFFVAILLIRVRPTGILTKF